MIKERIGGDYFYAASARGPSWKYSPPNAISYWIQDKQSNEMEADRGQTE